MRLPAKIHTVVLALSLSSVPPLAADDWPQFRGPTRDGKSTEKGLLRSWPKEGPTALWRAELGGGYSGIAVAGGRVFTLSSEKEGETLLAFDAATGRELWRTRTDRDRPDGQGSGPRSTPAVYGDRVFAISAFGKLHSMDVETGEIRWSINLPRELDARVPEWGYSGSPLVHEGVLYVETGAGKNRAVTALSPTSGEVHWRGGTNYTGYSSPLISTLAGVPHLILFGAQGVSAIGPATGHRYWNVPWQTRMDVNAAMPVPIPPDRLFVTSGYGVGGMMMKLRREGSTISIEQAWRARRMRSTFASPVAHDGLLYGFDEDTLRCLDVETGKEQWSIRRSAGSLVVADGLLLVLSGSGQLFLAEATAEEWRPVGETQAVRGRTWNAPALADGVLYLRNGVELVAFEVAERSEPTVAPLPASE